MHKQWFWIFLLLISFASAHAARQPTANIIIFGDSLSDVGNNTWVNAYGTPITSFDHQGQKFLWPNYLAKKFLNQSAHASRHKKKDLARQTISYAFASADTSNHYLDADWLNHLSAPSINLSCEHPGLSKDGAGQTIACVPGLVRQVDLYLQDVNQKPLSHSLFFIWAGANDFFYQLPNGMPPQRIIATAINNIVAAKNKLISKGVSPQQIYVLNLPDLSYTPFAIQQGLHLTELSAAFNNALKSALINLNDVPLPLDHIIDIEQLVRNIVMNPTHYGFSNVTESCQQKQAIPVCDGYLFFDHKHGTAKANQLIADYIASLIT